jgi:hypothetical protein
MSRTSCIFQSNRIGLVEVCFSDVEAELKRLKLQLHRMQDGELGEQEKVFVARYNEDTEEFQGYPLKDVKVGQEEFDKDRAEVVEGYLQYTEQRFDKLVNHPVFKAAQGAFEQRRWPRVEHDQNDFQALINMAIPKSKPYSNTTLNISMTRSRWI